MIFSRTIEYLYKEIKHKNFDYIAHYLWQSEYNNNKYNTNDSEYQSWTHSLPLLIKDIYKAGLKKLNLIMEYPTPYDNRIDAILVGYNHDNKNQILLIENKQWSDNKIAPSYNPVDVRVLHSKRWHPIDQVQYYKKALMNSNSALNNSQAKIITIGYLHNLKDTNKLLQGPYKKWEKSHTKLFGKTDHEQFRKFLTNNFIKKNNSELTSNIIHANPVLNENDENGINKRLQENKPMIADQVRIYNAICHEIVHQINNKHLDNKHHKELIVVSGGPGTGKSILGFHLIKATRKIEMRNHIYNSKNPDFQYAVTRVRTFHNYMKYHYGINVQYLSNIMNYSPKSLLLLIIDEAQRMRYPIHKNLSQLFNIANLVIVLQDDGQRIDPTDYGSFENFNTFANETNIPIHHETLRIQKRNRHNNNLVKQDDLNKALDDLFKDNCRNPPKLNTIPLESFGRNHLKDMINRLKQIKNKYKYNKKFKIKLLAPFCWYWSPSAFNNVNKYIKPIKLSWNPGKKKNQNKWLDSKKDSEFYKVGCVYTIRGFDLDYSGFIWWDNLIWSSTKHKWIVHLKECKDSAFLRNCKNCLKENSYSKSNINNKLLKKKVKRFLINRYKILLTRATKGMAIWFKDSATRKHVDNFLGITHESHGVKFYK